MGGENRYMNNIFEIARKFENISMKNDKNNLFFTMYLFICRHIHLL